MTFYICYRQDGTYWKSGARERRITRDQAVRLLNLLWMEPAKWSVEAIAVFNRKD